MLYVCCMTFPRINIRSEANAADIYMYGIVGFEVDGNSLTQQITDIQSRGINDVNIYVNSPGGSVPEGIALFHVLERCEMNITFIVDGLAASMMAMLIQVPGATRKMGRYAKLMFHNVSGGAHGSSEELREYAKMMDDFQSNLVNILAERTTLSEDDVKATYFNGKDNWRNADEALKENLIDEVIDGKVDKPVKDYSSAKELVNIFQNQIQNSNSNTDTMDLTKVFNILNLNKDASADSIAQAIQNVINERNTLKNEAATLKDEKGKLDKQVKDMQAAEKKARDERISNMLDNAIQAKKITEKQRERYEKLAAADLESTEAILNEIPTPQSLGSLTGGESNNELTDEQKKWSFQDWQRNDPKGLTQMRNDNKELFNSLYKKAFGKEAPDA